MPRTVFHAPNTADRGAHTCAACAHARIFCTSRRTRVRACVERALRQAGRGGDSVLAYYCLYARLAQHGCHCCVPRTPAATWFCAHMGGRYINPHALHLPASAVPWMRISLWRLAVFAVCDAPASPLCSRRAAHLGLQASTSACHRTRALRCCCCNRCTFLISLHRSVLLATSCITSRGLRNGCMVFFAAVFTLRTWIVFCCDKCGRRCGELPHRAVFASLRA